MHDAFLSKSSRHSRRVSVCAAYILQITLLLASGQSLGAEGRAALCMADPVPAAPPPISLVIENTTLIDGSAAPPRSGTTLAIAGNRIVAVESSGMASYPSQARIIDGSGHFVIPGLWDTHVHIKNATPVSLSVFIAHGITSVRDMVGYPDQLLALRAQIRNREIVGPRLVISGPSLESPESIARAMAGEKTEDFSQTRIAVDGPDDATRAVDELLAMGVDFIKLRTWDSDETYFAIMRAARERNIQIVGHTPDSLDPLVAASAGQASFEHGFYPYPLSQYQETELDSILAAFAANQIVIVPTLVTWYERTIPQDRVEAIIADASNELDPRRRLAAQSLLDYWALQVATRDVFDEARRQGWNNAVDGMARDVGVMFNHGIRVMPGTDLATPMVFPGISLHEELALFVSKVGLTPQQALESATRVPAEFLGVDECLGSLATGKLADLVILSDNPVSDIANTQRIAGVVADGVYFDKDSLHQLTNP